jgi:hypothetical protein
MRRALTIAALLAVLAAAPALAMTNVVKIGSSVTIKSKGTTFHGRVKSKSGPCRRERTVKLFLVRKGRDQVAGKDTTNRRGKWRIRVSGFAGISMRHFYARVKKRSEGTAGTIYVCRAARSRTIKPSS